MKKVKKMKRYKVDHRQFEHSGVGILCLTQGQPIYINKKLHIFVSDEFVKVGDKGLRMLEICAKPVPEIVAEEIITEP